MNFAEYLLERNWNRTTPFLVGRDRIVTYPELIASVDSLTRFIRDTYGTDREILLMADNSFFFIVSYLAIIRSGNTAVLLETRIGDEDLSQIQKTCSLCAGFVQERYAGRFPNSLSLHTEKILQQEMAAGSECPPTKDDAVAVLIFTSGSTGAKKGVMLSHANLRANTESILQYLPLTDSDRIGVVLPFFYCYGASLLHTHLRAGGSMVLSSLVFPTAFLQDLRQLQCTGFAGVPSTFQILVNKTSFLQEKFPSLRYCTQAGGQLPAKYIGMIREAFPDIQFFVMYGATEATARLSFLPPELGWKKMGSIGKGIPGVSLEVLNPQGIPVREGEVGEVTAYGKNIMKGYYRDLEATRQVLREGRLYTGDLATVDKDGFIYIVGRSKNIIKSGGYRISPAEIEEYIISLPHVLGCIVLGIPDEILNEAVAAVVQAEPREWESLKDAILKACRSKFPSYKVPKYIQFMREFPLNSSQKVDRLKLREILKERNGSPLVAL